MGRGWTGTFSESVTVTEEGPQKVRLGESETADFLYAGRHEYVNAWTDWNNDKIFGPGEQVMNCQATTDDPCEDEDNIVSFLSDPIFIPHDAGGTRKTFRVVLNYERRAGQDCGGDNDPCPVLTWGDAVDGTLDIPELPESFRVWADRNESGTYQPGEEVAGAIRLVPRQARSQALPPECE